MFVLYFRGVSKAQHCDTIPEGAEKQKFSTTTINDRQLSSQKIRQKLSVIITNTNPPLQTLLFSRQNVKENAKMNQFFNFIKRK